MGVGGSNGGAPTPASDCGDGGGGGNGVEGSEGNVPESAIGGGRVIVGAWAGDGAADCGDAGGGVDAGGRGGADDAKS